MLLAFEDAKKVLEGLPVAGSLIRSEEELAREAKALFAEHSAVVLKADSPKFLHKIEQGLVAINIKTESDAMETYRRICKVAYAQDPQAKILLQPQVKGVEVIIGAKRDPTFGPVVLFGIGGTLTNLYKDFSLRLAPTTMEEAQSMLGEIVATKILDGYRGGAKADRESLAKLIVRLSQVMAAHPEIAEVDFNPVIADERGAWIVDAKIVTSDAAAGISAKRRASAAGPLERLFAPKSVAVIGASRDKDSVGYSILENLLKGGSSKSRHNKPFAGEIYPVNPKADKIRGKACYKSVLEIPGDVDLAVIAVPAKVVPLVIGQCAQKNVPYAIVISAGFSEAGEAGKALQEQMLQTAASKVRLIGPNCLGMLTPGVNASFAPMAAPAGGVAFLSQSGAIVDSVIDWANETGYGFSAIVSLGNQADLGAPELLDALREDPATKSAAIYLEGASDGAAFLESARRFAAKKPLVVLKGGKSAGGSEAISSHTGSMAGSYEVYRAAFRQAGIVEARTITELFALAQQLQGASGAKAPAGSGVAVVTNAGGVGVLLTDYCEQEGVPLLKLAKERVEALDKTGVMHPAWSRRNPLDLVGDARAERYRAAVSQLLADETVSGIIVAQTLQSMTQPEEDARIAIEAAKAGKKPVVACFLGGTLTRKSIKMLEDAGVPCAAEPLDAVRAMKGLLQLAKRQR